MNTLRVELLHFNPTNQRKPATNAPQIIPNKIRCKLRSLSPKSSDKIGKYSNRSRGDAIVKLAAALKGKRTSWSGGGRWKEESSRMAMLICVGIGVGVVMLMDENSKALALGPEGPLVEEFWDNMRRYGLYALTVSTGAIWALLEPIYELLKNPISAILVLIILGGGFFIVTQVVTAMVGLSDFSYQYGN